MTSNPILREPEPSCYVLLVEDDEALGRVTKLALEKRGYAVHHVKTIQAAQEALAQGFYALAILDLKLEDETSLGLLPELKVHNEAIKVLVLTAYASIATAVEAVKRGAYDYLPKPATVSDILNALDELDRFSGLGKGAKNSEGNGDAVESLDGGGENLSVISPKRLEWEHIQRVLLKNDGNISATARELNMHRRTLQRKLQKHPVKG